MDIPTIRWLHFSFMNLMGMSVYFFFLHEKIGGEWIQDFAHLLVVSRSKDASIARSHVAFAVWHKLYEAYTNTVVKVTYFNKKKSMPCLKIAFVQCVYIRVSWLPGWVTSHLWQHQREFSQRNHWSEDSYAGHQQFSLLPQQTSGWHHQTVIRTALQACPLKCQLHEVPVEYKIRTKMLSELQNEVKCLAQILWYNADIKARSIYH